MKGKPVKSAGRRNPAPAAPETAPQYSEFSRRNRQRKYDLGEEKKRILASIAAGERKAETLKVDQQRRARLIAGGQGIYQGAYDSGIGESQILEGRLHGLREALTTVEKEAAALEPTPEQTAKRREVQTRAAETVEARLKVVGQIDTALESLRALLAAYAEASAKLAGMLAEIDFTISDDLDRTRFETLARSLPIDVKAQSKHWANAFLGREQGKTECAIARDFVVFRETLACAGFFVRGEKPLLTEAQRKQIEYEPARPLTPGEVEELVRPKKEDAAILSVADMPGAGIVPLGLR